MKDLGTVAPGNGAAAPAALCDETWYGILRREYKNYVN